MEVWNIYTYINYFVKKDECPAHLLTATLRYFTRIISLIASSGLLKFRLFSYTFGHASKTPKWPLSKRVSKVAAMPTPPNNQWALRCWWHILAAVVATQHRRKVSLKTKFFCVRLWWVFGNFNYRVQSSATHRANFTFANHGGCNTCATGSAGGF